MKQVGGSGSRVADGPAVDMKGLFLVGSLVVSLACTGGATRPPRQAGFGGGGVPSSASKPEQELFARINAYRASKGLAALRWSDIIAEQARGHSRAMASGAAPRGHAAFEARLAAIKERIPISSWAENVVGDRNVEATVQRLLESPVHRENIEGDFDLTGVGAATDAQGLLYLTQIFVKTR